MAGKRKPLDAKKLMAKFQKTNSALDFAKWLRTMPDAQVKNVELVTKQGNTLGFKTEMARVKANLDLENF